MVSNVLGLLLRIFLLPSEKHQSHDRKISSSYDQYACSILDHPYMVSLSHVDNKDNYTHVCDGTLVSKYWALTTAHCGERLLKNGMWKSVWAVAGTTCLDQKEHAGMQFSQAKMFVRHPEYDKTTGVNDLALVKLKEALIDSSRVGFVEMPVFLDDLESSRDYNCSVKTLLVSWSEQSGCLQCVKQNFTAPANEPCGTSWDVDNNLDRDQGSLKNSSTRLLCSRGNTDHQSSCTVCSGALMCGNVQTGLMFTGNNVSNNSTVMTFTRLQNYLEFIYKNVVQGQSKKTSKLRNQVFPRVSPSIQRGSRSADLAISSAVSLFPGLACSFSTLSLYFKAHY